MLLNTNGICYANTVNLKYNNDSSRILNSGSLSSNESVFANNITVASSNQCLQANLSFNTASDQTSTHIVPHIIVKNFCSWSVDLSRYYFSFISQDIDGNAVELPTLFVLGWPNVYYQNYVTLRLQDPNNPRNGLTTGYFVANSPIQYGPIMLLPNQSFIANGDGAYNKSFKFVTPATNPPLVINTRNMLGINEVNDIVYGNDSLTNIPVGQFGLKTYVITNYSLSDINYIAFSYNFPPDINFDRNRLTCKLDATQVLRPSESCSVVIKYTPKIQGVSSSLTLGVAGISSESQQLAKAPDISVLYSSRITDAQQPDTQVDSNTKIGITVVTPSNFTYESDSLVNIPVGSFGLKSYTITNISSVKLYAVTLPKLPSNEFSYDTRTTCGELNNKLILSPAQSCNIVIKYMPVSNGEYGNLLIQVAGYDNYYNVFANEVFNLPYSSR